MPGLWLIKPNGREFICEIGQETEYSNKVLDIDHLCEYLLLMDRVRFWNTVRIDKDGAIVYNIESVREEALNILSFLSKTPQEQEEVLEAIRNQPKVDEQGNLRTRTGKLLKQRFSNEARVARIKSLYDRIKEEERALYEDN